MLGKVILEKLKLNKVHVDTNNNIMNHEFRENDNVYKKQLSDMTFHDNNDTLDSEQIGLDSCGCE